MIMGSNSEQRSSILGKRKAADVTQHPQFHSPRNRKPAINDQSSSTTDEINSYVKTQGAKLHAYPTRRSCRLAAAVNNQAGDGSSTRVLRSSKRRIIVTSPCMFKCNSIVDDDWNTPTSEDHQIPPAKVCPAPPQKKSKAYLAERSLKEEPIRPGVVRSLLMASITEDVGIVS